MKPTGDMRSPHLTLAPVWKVSMEPGSGLGVALRPAHLADNQRKDEL